MTTEIDICNKAIARLAGAFVTSSSGLAADLDNSSLEAKLCRANYPIIRDVVTEDRVWSFALKRAILDVPSLTKPLFGFDQQFSKPVDALNIWRVHYDMFNAVYVDGQSDVPTDWRVEGDMILANAEKIFVEYIRRMDQPGDIDLFTPQFMDTLSIRLAAEICIPLTQNGSLFGSLSQEYEARKLEAYAINGSQAKHETFRSTQLTRVR